MARGQRRGAPTFSGVEDIQAKIDGYFELCRGEPMQEEDTGKPVLDKKGKPVMTGNRPPTVTGLALALGFDTREDMLNYRGKAAYAAAILRGRSRVEQYAEECLFDKECSAGAKFVLESGLLKGNEGAALKTAEAVADVMAEVRARMLEDAEGD